jgi:hypothetical protein
MKPKNGRPTMTDAKNAAYDEHPSDRAINAVSIATITVDT